MELKVCISFCKYEISFENKLKDMIKTETGEI